MGEGILVTNKEGKLTGRLSLKDLLTAEAKTKISDVFIPKVDYVTVHTENEEVARIMQKYDLEAIPVVDDHGILVGRITIDDIVDFIKPPASAKISQGKRARMIFHIPSSASTSSEIPAAIW